MKSLEKRKAPIRYFITLVVCVAINSSVSFAQDIIQYKQVDTTKLSMKVFYPEQVDSSKTYPAMVFYHGGGWIDGGSYQFNHHAKYFSKRGLVCFLIQYRTEKSNKASPFEALKDAKSAIRFIRKNASKFGIDGTKIIASGGSSGGHLAAATAIIDGYNESTDDLSISCIPDALVLFNPVVDNGPGGYAYERIGDEYKNFSPIHNIKRGAPPTIFILGTNDHLIPVETANYYKKVMEKVGSRCELILFEGRGHGFFNYKKFESYKNTVIETDNFLISLGYLEDDSTLTIEK